jgi:hypothetical protein
MITIRFDSILQAIAIERGDKQRVYSPSPASIRRALQLTCHAHWVFRPCFQAQLFVWEKVQHG